MNFRTFGKLGWRVSEIGFGAWAIGGDMWGPQDDGESLRALHRAIDLGVNFIDTAQGYGKGHSEELIGKVLKERKEQLFIATKVPPVPGQPWPPAENADARVVFPASYIIEQCEGSLRRLGREWIDVYQFHTWATRFNEADEWFEAMSRLKQQGKIRAIGVSVPDTTPDNVIGSLVRERVDAIQVIYNLFEQYPRWNLFPVCRAAGTAVIVRVPFDEGALTGRMTPLTTFADGDVRSHYFRGRNLPAVVRRVEAIRQFVSGRHPGMSLPEFALRFCLSQKAASTVIPGIRNIAQAEANVAAGTGPHLGGAELHELETFAWRKDFWHVEVDD
jgi:aryl-alcohol dehydrogenase-like predicted oxidoreductase